MTMQVSAEVAAVTLDQPFELKKVHKSTDAEEGIRTAMQHCFLFAGTWHFPFLSAGQAVSTCSPVFLGAAAQGSTLFGTSHVAIFWLGCRLGRRAEE